MTQTDKPTAAATAEQPCDDQHGHAPYASAEKEANMPSTDLIYQLEDRPPFRDALFAAVQHLLSIFVAIVTPPLIIAGALKFDLATTSFLVSAALFASGVATFVQCRRIGFIGARLLCVQGTSFSFISPIINAGILGGLPLIFGTTMAAAFVEMGVSRLLRYTRRIITPLVSGIVVMLIGLSLLKAGVTACGGGQAAIDNGTFGSLENIGIAALVLVLIIFFNRQKNKYLRMSSIVIGVAVGYIVAWSIGMVSFDGQAVNFAQLQWPKPFHFGLSFDFGTFIAFGLVYLVTSIEAYGDITANSLVSGEPVEGEKFEKRAMGGIMADGFNSLLAGALSSFPNSIFAQNNGMIQLTGIASRYVGYFVAALLVLLGVFPGVGMLFSLMPEPVLGGATLLMFGMVATTGVRIIATNGITSGSTLVIALSLALGLGVELQPAILSQLPKTLQSIFCSGITTGGLTAILGNLLINYHADAEK